VVKVNKYVVNRKTFHDRASAIAYANSIHQKRGVIVAVEEKKTRKKNPAHKATKYYCVDQEQKGLWYQIAHFTNKAKAFKFAHELIEKSGRKVRVKKTFPSADVKALLSIDPFKKNPLAVFTPAQLSELRTEYAKIKSIDPGGAAYPKLAAKLDKLSQAQLKQLAGAEILFISKLARNRVRGKNPIKGPGKFGGEMYAGKYAYENPDEEIGESDTLGWYGKFFGKIKGRGPFYIIVSEDYQGFVRAEFFDTRDALDKAWKGIEKEYEKFYHGADADR